jgi:DNA-binding CsgD family transcriptional regulator
MIPETITVAVKGKHSLYCAALEALINDLPGLRVVKPNSQPPPQVLLWDAWPGELENLPVVTAETAVLLLIIGQECHEVPAGVAGLFSTEEPPNALGIAIRQVARGEQYLSVNLALAMLHHLDPDNSPHKFVKLDQKSLTSREREILALLGEGLSNKSIAARLYLSVRTVEGHLAKLYPRLGVQSRMEAMLLASKSNISPLIR